LVPIHAGACPLTRLASLATLSHKGRGKKGEPC
jgi:hypothetical protein